jgi:hypothetical protein
MPAPSLFPSLHSPPFLSPPLSLSLSLFFLSLLSITLPRGKRRSGQELSLLWSADIAPAHPPSSKSGVKDGVTKKKIPILESQATTRRKDVEGERTGTEKIADDEKLFTLQRVEETPGAFPRPAPNQPNLLTGAMHTYLHQLDAWRLSGERTRRLVRHWAKKPLKGKGRERVKRETLRFLSLSLPPLSFSCLPLSFLFPSLLSPSLSLSPLPPYL